MTIASITERLKRLRQRYGNTVDDSPCFSLREVEEALADHEAALAAQHASALPKNDDRNFESALWRLTDRIADGLRENESINETFDDQDRALIFNVAAQTLWQSLIGLRAKAAKLDLVEQAAEASKGKYLPAEEVLLAYAVAGKLNTAAMRAEVEFASESLRALRAALSSPPVASAPRAAEALDATCLDLAECLEIESRGRIDAGPIRDLVAERQRLADATNRLMDAQNRNAASAMAGQDREAKIAELVAEERSGRAAPGSALDAIHRILSER